jgi:hypothetical protein
VLQRHGTNYPWPSYLDLRYFAIDVLSAEDYHAPLHRKLEDALHAGLVNPKTLRVPVVAARPGSLIERLIAAASGSPPPK